MRLSSFHLVFKMLVLIPASYPSIGILTVEDDTQKRYSFFYFIGTFFAALCGVLAFGFMQLDGREGLGGWRWIFILEGVVCLLLSFRRWRGDSANSVGS